MRSLPIMLVGIWAVVALYALALGVHAHPVGQHAFQVDSMYQDIPELPPLRGWSMRLLERTWHH